MGIFEVDWDYIAGEVEEGMTYVKVIESRPPPAPASAWAILSPCWAAEMACVIASLSDLEG